MMNSPWHHRIRLATLLGVAALIVGAGCREAATIRQYEVPKPLGYTLPEGWTRARGDAFSLAAFEVRADDGRARVTVSTLGPTGADLLANVNRWRRQTQLEPIVAEQLKENVTPFEVAGTNGSLVKLDGPEQSIVGVIAVRGQQSWFFKMMGTPALVARETPQFEAFVRSIQFNML